MTFHPSDTNTFWVGSPSGGFWKSSDGGASFHTTTDHLSSIGISDIIVHPNNPDTIFIITGDRDGLNTYSIGLLKSYDGGETWKNTAVVQQPNDFERLNRLVLDPTNPARQYLASSNGILITDDYWESYQSSSVVDEAGNTITGNFMDIKMHPANNTILYASLSNRIGNRSEGIFRSVDMGLTFTQVEDIWSLEGFTDAGRIELAVAPSEPNIVYALVGNKNDGGYLGLLQSIDEGQTWRWQNSYKSSGNNYFVDAEHVLLPGGQAWYDMAIVVNPDNANEIWIGALNTWRSLDGGVSFDPPGGGGIHVDIHDLKFQPHTKRLYACHDGGISKYFLDNSLFPTLYWKWDYLGSHQLGIMQIYRLDVFPYNSTHSISGCQDVGTMKRVQHKWENILIGDGMECIVDPVELHIYMSNQYGKIFKSIDQGNNYTNITPLVGSENGEWITPFEMNPLNHKDLIIGYSDILRTRDGGDSWQQITNRQTTSGIDVLAFAPSDSSYIFYSDMNNIFKSDDGGETWGPINNGLPNYYITDITVSDLNPQRVWVSFSGYGNGEKIYESLDGGASWNNISAGLPNLPVNVITEDSKTAPVSKLFAGTDAGVYVWNEFLVDWLYVGDGLPNVIVNDIVYRDYDARIVVGTFGRGMWQTSTYLSVKPDLSADFHSDYSISCPGREIVLHYDGSDQIDSLLWIIDNGEEQIETRERNPEVVFSEEGSPNVTLKVYDNGKEVINSKEEFFLIKENDNDHICEAITIQDGWNGPYTNYCATVEVNEPIPPASVCSSQISWCENELLDNTVWFKFIPNESGEMEIISSGFDNQIAVYAAESCEEIMSGNYTLLAANDDYNMLDFSAGIEKLSGLTAGKEYYIQVDGSFGGIEGDFYLNLIPGIVDQTNVPGITRLGQLEVYPNPNNGRFKLIVPADASNAILSVYNSSGAIILEESFSDINGKSDLNIKLDNSEVGLYFVHLMLDGISYRTKVMLR